MFTRNHFPIRQGLDIVETWSPWWGRVGGRFKTTLFSSALSPWLLLISILATSERFLSTLLIFWLERAITTI